MRDFWTEQIQSQQKIKYRKLALLIGILLIIISIIIMIFVYIYNTNFRKWCDKNILGKEISQENTKSIDIEEGENVQVYAYEKYICVLRKKKLEYYNKLGTKVDSIDIDINNAVFTSAGRYMAISEKDGQKFYLICGKEKIYEEKIEGNISQINVSRNGYVSLVILNTSYKTVVDIYDQKGTEVFKTNLVTSVVADVSISNDSKYLAIAEVDMSGILIKSSIQVVSIESAQMLYKYEAPTDKLIINISYQEQNNIVCMYNDSIDLLQGQESKEIINVKNQDISFMTINLSNRVALLKEISTGEYTSDTNVNIINPIISKKKEYNVNDIAKAVKASDNKIAINFGTELHIIDSNGFLIKNYKSETEINDIVITDSLVGVVYRDKIQIINL